MVGDRQVAKNVASVIWAIFLVLLATAFVGGGLFFEHDARAWIYEFEKIIESWGPWGVVVSIGLMVVHSFVPFPAEFLAIANGMLYGAFLGTLVTWTGAMLGALLAFALSRFLGRRFVRRMLSRRSVPILETLTDETAVSWIFLARFVPVIAFNLINYAAGLTKIGWWTFTWTTGIGILPLTALMVSMGSSLHHLEWQWWLVLFAGGLVAWLLLRWCLPRFAQTR